MNYGATQNVPSLGRRLRRFVNGLGRRCYCCICGRHFTRFSKFRGGHAAVSRYLRDLEWISSDFDNFWCPFCRSHDRERHLFLYFDALALWPQFKGKDILHLAPEKYLALKLADQQPASYIKGDLVPSRAGVVPLDVTAIDYGNEHFDWVICNHVLEHVPDDALALREIWRVLRPGGRAILQTPYAAKLERSVEDAVTGDDQSRRLVYGQEDHVRLYGRDLFERIQAAGFELQIKEHAHLLADLEVARYGVNPAENLVLCVKP